MKRIISAAEIVGSFMQDGRRMEVCAIAEANFDESQSQLQIELNSFVRPVDLRAREQHLEAGWLPNKQNLKESVSQDEAIDLAKEIFHRWVAKVRRAIPFLVTTQ